MQFCCIHEYFVMSQNNDLINFRFTISIQPNIFKVMLVFLLTTLPSRYWPFFRVYFLLKMLTFEVNNGNNFLYFFDHGFFLVKSITMDRLYGKCVAVDWAMPRSADDICEIWILVLLCYFCFSSSSSVCFFSLQWNCKINNVLKRSSKFNKFTH